LGVHITTLLVCLWFLSFGFGVLDLHHFHVMNNKLQQFDSELYEKLCKDFDRNEIRGSERIVIEDWLAKALITESLLGLLRKDLIEINGLSVSDDGQIFEPTFLQSEFLKTGLEELQSEAPDV
jgi:hypothetical protein